MVNHFKETNTGKIPVEWSYDILENCLNIETGNRNTEDKKENGRYPFFVRSQKVERINTFNYDCEAVLTAGDGVGTGKVFHYIVGKFDAHQRVYVLTTFRNLIGKYFYYFFSENFLKEVSKYTAKSSVDSVRRDMVAKMTIPLPPLPEQVAIAEALSDVDSLIFSLQKLIDKKKAIKEGAIQELLTGKKRLPGFGGDWKKIALSSYVDEFIVPMRDKPRNLNGDIPWCRIEDFDGKYLSKSKSAQGVDKNTIAQMNLKVYPVDTLLVSCSAYLGRCAIVKRELVTNQTFIGLVPKKNTDVEFLFYIMCKEEKSLNMLSSGTTISYLSREQFETYFVLFPPTLKEQQAIAEILSDMDTEIELLEKKLTKYQQIKQGMLQELLTGRIRLLDTEISAQRATQKAQTTIKLPAHKPHNQQFDDAVIIAGIVNAFYSDKFPLGRKKVQKLLYLMRRKEQADTSAFHKKAAGPYADEVRYKGGEPIAKKNEYIQISKNDKGSRFARGKKIEQALAYLQDWGKQPDMDWLVSQFQFTSVNELELLATVDMAMCDLRQKGKQSSVHSIKELISATKEWREKLNKTYFKDSDIQWAIQKCEELFGTE